MLGKRVIKFERLNDECIDKSDEFNNHNVDVANNE